MTTDYLVPAGSYVCEIVEVRLGMTRAGDELWTLRLVVTEGEHSGGPPRSTTWCSRYAAGPGCGAC